MTRNNNGVWELSDTEMNVFLRYAFTASDGYGDKYPTLADEAEQIGDFIYEQLDKAGFYGSQA